MSKLKALLLATAVAAAVALPGAAQAQWGGGYPGYGGYGWGGGRWGGTTATVATRATAAAAATMAPPPSRYPYLPLRPWGGDLPRGRLELEQFGQVNSTRDPFDPWGLSTPFMFVPWSTPLSAWTNAQTWNWWRERTGAPPPNW